VGLKLQTSRRGTASAERKEVTDITAEDENNSAVGDEAEYRDDGSMDSAQQKGDEDTMSDDKHNSPLEDQDYGDDESISSSNSNDVTRSDDDMPSFVDEEGTCGSDAGARSDSREQLREEMT